jgi:Ca2+-binding RTX toxin-like protein
MSSLSAASLSPNLIEGSDSADILVGDDADNIFYGLAGDDQISSAGGSDLLIGGSGSDRLDGGTGTDSVSYATSSVGVRIDLTTGAVAGGDAQGDILVSIESVVGSTYDDRLVGTDASNDLDGLDGNDTLDARLGVDRVDGGFGLDTLVVDYSRNEDGVGSLFGGGAANGTISRTNSKGKATDRIVYSNIERFSLVGTSQNDQLQGWEEADSLTGGAGDDYLLGRSGADVLAGGRGQDTASYITSTVGVAIDLTTGSTAGGEATGDVLQSIEALVGSNFTDELYGDSNNNVINPGIANIATSNDARNGASLDTDIVDGRAGTDLLILDFSVGDFGTSVTNPSWGANWVGSSGSYERTLPWQSYSQTVRLSNVEWFSIVGTRSNDQLFGWTGTDYLNGGAGDDLLHGGTGNDTILGGDGNDIVVSQTDYQFSIYGNLPRGYTNVVNLDGGAGLDTLYVNLSNKAENIVLDTSGTQQLLRLADGTQVTNFEILKNIYTGDGNDQVVQLGQIDNVIQTGSGDDIVNPGLSLDLDQIDGGSGKDLLVLDFSSASESFVSSGFGSTNFILHNLQTSIISRINAMSFELLNLTGTSNNDTIFGTDGGDVVGGGAGNDFISALGGSDTINGGEGDDTVVAANRANDLFALQTNDVVNLDGGSGVDTLSVNLSQKQDNIVLDSINPQPVFLPDGTSITNFEIFKDILTGSGNDTLVQLGRVDNQWSTGAGSDYVNPGVGIDSIDGGGGNDLLVLDYSNESGVLTGTISGYSVIDVNSQVLNQVTLSDFEQVNILGTVNDDNFTGSAGADTLNGWSGNDAIDGGTGDDILIGGWGDDVLNGGDGIDRIVEASDVNFTLTNTSLIGLGTDTFTTIEQAEITGGAGNNVIDAAAFTLGAVTLDGGAGNDILSGGNANDSFIGGSGDDQINGGAGSDSIIAFADVNFTLSDTSLVGLGTDTLTSIEQAILISGNSDSFIDTSAFSGSATLNGQEGNDVLIGGSNQGELLSQYASSVIAFTSQYSSGSFSATQMLGAPNTFSYGDSPTAWAASSRDGTVEQVTLGFDAPIFATGVTIRQNWGNGFVRKIEVLSVSDTYSTVWEEVDTSQPGAPVDFLAQWETTNFQVKGIRITVDTNHNLNAWEEIDSVQLHGAFGTTGDTLKGGQGSDLLEGGGGNDSLFGEAGVDTLIGGSGNDFLVGGAGSDILTGGTGSDRFAYFFLAAAGDTITDFAPGAGDILDVQSLIDSLGYAGSDPFLDGFIGLVDQPTGGTQVQIDSDGLGSAAGFTPLVTLDGVTAASLGSSIAF